MKPYPPLGLLYLSAYLKRAGFSVEVFDSTFAERAELDARFAATPGGVVGIYTNLMTRRSVLEIVRAAQAHRLDRDAGRAGERQLHRRISRTRAPTSSSSAKASSRWRSCCRRSRGSGATPPARGARHRLSRRDRRDRAHAGARQGRRPRHPALARSRGHRSPAVSRRLEDSSRRQQHQSDHGARLSVSLQLVLARRVRLHASAPQPGERRRRAAMDRRALRPRPGLVRRRCLHHQPSVADDVQRRAAPPRHSSAVRDHHARRSAADAKPRPPSCAELGCYRIWIGSESGSQRILDAMQRGVTVEQVRRACELAHAHGIQVGMFLMWGYEGEELEDIAATVEHVKVTNPDIFFTTVSYPIKGTGYFEKVRERVRAPLAWAEASDRDYVDRRPARQGLLQARRPVAAQRGRGRARCRPSDPGALGRVAGRGAAAPATPCAPGARRERGRPRICRASRVIAAALRRTTEQLARELATPGTVAAGLESISNGTWRARWPPCRASPCCWRTGCAGGDRRAGRPSSSRSAGSRSSATRASMH